METGCVQVLPKGIQSEIQRNLSHFYTLTMKDQKEILKKQSHLPPHQKEQNT